MSALFTTGKQGVPITLLDTASFPQWLDTQPQHHRAWLASTHYQGDGLSLIPATDGRLEAVIVGSKTVEHPLVCGDLPLRLPEGQYRLMGCEAQQRSAAIAWGMGAYRFTPYKTAGKPLPTLVLPTASLLDDVQGHLDAITTVRDLINTPASDMMPEHLGAAVEALAVNFGAEVEQVVGDELLAQNYPAIHAVGRASQHAPRLIDLRWGDPNHPKVTLVGKGVCFDSGGLDVKGAASMRLMKKDMGGAAQVVGLAQLIMAHALPLRLRVLIPAVENAIAGNAYRPGDIIKTRKGLTVEIENTDAEGRLILCDALTEADSESPELLLDFATLTGATTVALGHEMAGVFTAQSEIAQAIVRCGDAVADPVWPLPLYQPYQDLLKSEVADWVNCTKDGIAGGTLAALYLQAFVSEQTPWLHFDIMAWNSRPLPGRPLGGDVSGIRAVFEYLQRRYSA